MRVPAWHDRPTGRRRAVRVRLAGAPVTAALVSPRLVPGAGRRRWRLPLALRRREGRAGRAQRGAPGRLWTSLRSGIPYAPPAVPDHSRAATAGARVGSRLGDVAPLGTCSGSGVRVCLTARVTHRARRSDRRSSPRGTATRSAALCAAIQARPPRPTRALLGPPQTVLQGSQRRCEAGPFVEAVFRLRPRLSQK